MKLDSSWEVLGVDECLGLLASRQVGRLALTSGALPVVLPVPFALVGGRIVVPTKRGTTLAAATAGAVVAFQVDDVDPQCSCGWSVMVTGVAAELADANAVTRLSPVPFAEHQGRLIAISTDVVSGWRIPGARPNSAAAPPAGR